jgi:DNA-binding FrmR family transcriptional regulator
MRRVYFDYPNTCPQIDKQIGAVRDEIFNFLNGLLKEACPLLDDKTLHEVADQNANLLYERIEDCFEVTRETNEKMRREAEKQIDALQSELTDLEHELQDIQSRIEA